MAKRLSGSVKAKRITMDIIVHIFLVIVAIIWLIPFIWLVAHSFRADEGQFCKTFFPTNYTIKNYTALFTDFGVINFPRMFMHEPVSVCLTDLLIVKLGKLCILARRSRTADV